MRIVLTQSHLSFKDQPDLPEGLVAFLCFEDFSVGPVADWERRDAFRMARSDFWQATQALDLPDDTKMDYFVWIQTLPRHDLVALLQQGMAIEDIPEDYEFDDVIPRATRIEVWHDQSVRGCCFRWYSVAVLKDLGVDASVVSLCVLPDFMQDQKPSFWSAMLLDRPDRAVAAVPCTPTEWAEAQAYWAARTRLPTAPQLPPDTDAATRDAFSVLVRRYPDPVTGLTNLQELLLPAVGPEWQKMVRIVADAMVAGFDENDGVGDWILQAELEAMAKATPPLVEIEGTGAMRFCKVRLTSDGEALLAKHFSSR